MREGSTNAQRRIRRDERKSKTNLEILDARRQVGKVLVAGEDERKPIQLGPSSPFILLLVTLTHLKITFASAPSTALLTTSSTILLDSLFPLFPPSPSSTFFLTLTGDACSLKLKLPDLLNTLSKSYSSLRSFSFLGVENTSRLGSNPPGAGDGDPGASVPSISGS
ncbi:hypothetical protein BDY24DRAFT_111960 [Mrakia frigida]|uniref:uncharacterized protein n=1 Tax=Mrakia frigida TaxID=29902 RepID=UPI003FCC0C0A